MLGRRDELAVDGREPPTESCLIIES